MHDLNDSRSNELPSSASLLKSTLLAGLVASVILVTIVLPAEYAIDPTGVGSVLGLTAMGEIKTQLVEEAEADVAPSSVSPLPAVTQPMVEDSAWRDKTAVDIAPGEAIELKLVMTEGDRAAYEWNAGGGALNFNEHGDGEGREIEYGKGRATPSRTGELIAAFDGYHGWFWRNRTEEKVSLTLRTRGSYSSIKRTR